MKPISFETDDGEKFTNQKEAKRHEVKLELLEKIQESNLNDMDKEDILEFLAGDAVRILLMTYLRPLAKGKKRGRKQDLEIDGLPGCDLQVDIDL